MGKGAYSMGIEQKPFGTTKAGEAVELYTLKNSSGAFAEILTYGGIIRAIDVPDKNGALADVVLGYDTLGEYEEMGGYLGALIGRVGNRIAHGRFSLGGKEYTLFCNDGNNHLHGGRIGFNAKVWKARIEEDKLLLQYHSPDGEEGYPGALTVTVAYSFSEENELTIDYHAVSDRDTVVNLTNHAYFNLAGQGSGTILNQQLRLNCKNYTENSAECVPTGVIAPVAGTPLDFMEFHTIGERIGVDNIQLKNCGGYDHNFCIERPGPGLQLAAELWDEASGRLMETYTTKPGVQLYTGNFMDESYPAKGGGHYCKNAGLCLETQYYPNATEHSHFPSIVLRGGEEYVHATAYRFSVK